MIENNKTKKLEQENKVLLCKLNELSKQFEEKVSQLSMVREMGLTLMHINNFKLACQTILDVIIKNTIVQNCSIMLMDYDLNKLFLVAATDPVKHSYVIEAKNVFSKEGVRYCCMMPGEGAAGSAVKEKKSILINDVEKSPVYCLDTSTHVKIGSILSIPLMVEDVSIGVLNLSHSDKNVFESSDINIFNIISNFIGLAIHSILNHEEMLYSEQKYRALANYSNDAIAIVQDGVHRYANPRYLHLTGYSLKELETLPFEKLVADSKHSDAIHDLKNILSKQHSHKQFETLLINKTGEKIEVEINASSFIYSGKIAAIISARGFTAHRQLEKTLKEAKYDLEQKVKERTLKLITANKQMLFEISERKRVEEQIKASLKEKVLLLQEVHHRVKNNMQIVSSMLNLQADSIQNLEAIEMFKECQGRIKSMALIHENLYKSKDMTKIDYNEYIIDLSDSLFRSYGVNASKISLKTDIENVWLGVDAGIPCGLIINELVSNSLKHAFPEDKDCNERNKTKNEIKISLRYIDADMIELIVNDSGIGIPGDMDFKNTESLGLQLVTMLAEDQLQGKIDLDRTRRGATFIIRFKEKK